MGVVHRMSNMTEAEEFEYIRLLEEDIIDNARDDFYSYCKLKEPDFYIDGREHLEILCNLLNDFHYNKLLKKDGTPYTKIIINMPPQHGKSRTLVLFTQWALGKNNQERIITASYSEDAATDFSRYTRDGIQEEKAQDELVYSDIFPETKIKRGNASYNKWALEGQHFNYLGTSINGAVTGKGATLRIVDDLVKDANIATNKTQLNKIWIWYSGTYSSRNSAEGGVVKEIFCATPWSEFDVQGILKKTEPDEWYVVSMEIMKDKQMLCDDFMSYNEYVKLKERMLRNPITAMVFWANYHNKTVDVEGRLYKSFRTYSKLPMDEKGGLLFNQIKAYCDTADTGKDYLCQIIYGEYQNKNYVLDVYYTQEPMEITEVEAPDRLNKYKVNVAEVESNNGGRGFAREIQKYTKTVVKWFHQSKNKEVRIHTNSARVQEDIIYPDDWMIRWPVYYESMTNYSAKGKNEHDDAQDATTGVIEKSSTESWGWK